MIVSLATCDSPFSLDELATRIRASSNFRFNWQFYRFEATVDSPADVRAGLEQIIAHPELHAFLRDSFDPMYERSFRIEPLHEHARMNPTTYELEGVLASAAGDHLGAYSRELREAHASEREFIRQILAQAGEYRSFELLPGDVPGCERCRDYNNHLFSSWFFEVAWDWCLLAVWPARKLLWLGCLTDTD